MKQGTAKGQYREFLVTESGGLLDFLLLRLTGKSRNNVKSLLTYKAVLVNGRVVTKYDHALSPGQTVQVMPINKSRNTAPDILYEDTDLIVINKPAGMLSIATDKGREMTAYRLLTYYVKQSNPKGRVFIVHRLDRDTSGILMIAKNERIKLALQDNWSELVSERGYMAIVEGRLAEKSGRIHSWLKETKSLLVYSGKVAGDGLEAITNYQVVRETKDYSLLTIQLETGRKNQIRMHMKDLGHPVVGDKKYGAAATPIKRLGLHAYKLAFRHPFTNDSMCFETEMPKEFQRLFKG